MAYIILWYLISSLLGLCAFPLSFRILQGLPDRGYAASRALGLLLWGYAFWLLASFNLLTNTRSVLVLSLVIFAAAAAWLASRLEREQVVEWWKSRGGYVVAVEALFLVCFAGWAFIRGTNPEAIGTEKPMELAFINAIIASPEFPPHDPWLSGYSISYYYFGYVLVAMLAKLSGSGGAMAFNLGISLVFGMSACGAFGLVYNLLDRHVSVKDAPDQAGTARKISLSLLGPIFVLIASNLEGFLHVLHTRGVLWLRDETGQLVSGFWRWLDIKDLNLPPSEPFRWVPDRFWWWWRASRVVQDYDLAGNPKEIIDEFPFFSYLLADLHPHVLAMPFAFLAMTLALQALFRPGQGRLNWFHWQINTRNMAWGSILMIPAGVVVIGSGISKLNFLLASLGILLLAVAGFTLLRMWGTLAERGSGVLVRGDLGTVEVGRAIRMEPAAFLLAAVVTGSLAFLNTWDFPLYVGLFSAACTLGLFMSSEINLRDMLKEFLWLSFCLGLAGVLLFLPFYLGFSSQVGGIIPNLIYVTRGAHLWVMFGVLFVPMLVFLGYQVSQSPHKKTILLKGFGWALAAMAALWALALLAGAALVFLGEAVAGLSQLYQASLASPGPAELFLAAVSRRFGSPGGWITLTVLLGLVLAVFYRLIVMKRQEGENGTDGSTAGLSKPAPVFSLLLILFGALLVTGPEFFYLQDQFGWRMNTIFKFYYQAWLIWGIAAAYCSAYLLLNLRGAGGLLWRLGLVILLAASLAYPLLSLWNKTGGLSTAAWTLDSSAYLEAQSPEVVEAIRWLRTAPPGIIAEGVPPSGGSYTGHAVVSTLSGLPAVLGWFGHESQWRGGGELLSPRQNDLASLFCSRDWEETQTVLERYQIRYVILGNLEREAYRAGENLCPGGLFEGKFQRYLRPVFQLGQTTIYEYALVQEE